MKELNTKDTVETDLDTILAKYDTQRVAPNIPAKELIKRMEEQGQIRMTPPSRFDYIKYDGEAAATQERFKKLVQELETHLEKFIDCPRSKASAITNLELVYMWIGKGIRNDQIKRTKFFELQEERNKS